MSWVRNLLAFAVAVAAFTAGGVAVNFALQTHTLVRHVEPEPESVKPAALAKGPAGKTHLEITDFKFGEPIIEQNGDEWEAVWLPIMPAKTKLATPYLFFRSTRVRDQAALDEFLKQQTLRVFVANTALTRSYWGTAVSQDVYLKYPKLDFDKLTVVTEPDFEVPYARQFTGASMILPTDFMMSPRTGRISWGVAGGSLILGMILAALLITPNHQATIRDASCGKHRQDTGTSVIESYRSSIPERLTKADETARAREILMQEHPVSSHSFRAMGMVTTTIMIMLGLLVFIGIFGAVLWGSTQSRTNGPAIAGVTGLFAAGVFMFFVYFAKRSLDRNAKSVDTIQICPNGLRWQLGKDVRMAAWSEIALVERVTIDVNNKKQVMAAQFGLVGAIAASMGSADDGSNLTRQSDTVHVQFHNGDVMIFSSESLSDYVTFATTIYESHGSEARRYQVGGDQGAIARALILPGPSNFTMANWQPRR